MKSTTPKELEHLRTGLGEWALGDVRKAAAGGAKVGSFILAGALIEALAGLAHSRSTENSKAAWDEFVPVFLPRYDGHAEDLYRGYRGALSHSYSVDDVLFRRRDRRRTPALDDRGGRTGSWSRVVRRRTRAGVEIFVSAELDDASPSRSGLRRPRKQPAARHRRRRACSDDLGSRRGAGLALNSRQPKRTRMPLRCRRQAACPSVARYPEPDQRRSASVDVRRPRCPASLGRAIRNRAGTEPSAAGRSRDRSARRVGLAGSVAGA